MLRTAVRLRSPAVFLSLGQLLVTCSALTAAEVVLCEASSSLGQLEWLFDHNLVVQHERGAVVEPDDVPFGRSHGGSLGPDVLVAEPALDTQIPAGDVVIQR